MSSDHDQITTTADTARKLPRGVLIAFTLPTLILGVMHGPEGMIQGVYAKYAGLSLTSLAAALLLTRIFDAVTYPLIGALSDRSYARSGTRTNWTLAGTVLSVIGIWFLLRPPPGVTIWYFGGWMAVVYLGWKVIEIPLQAWSYTLSSDYAQRARVQAWRGTAQIAGALLFLLIPLLASQLGASASPELDFRNLGFAAAICAVALPLATLALIRRVPRGEGAPPAAPQRFALKEILAAVRGNPPLLRLCLAFLPVCLLNGLMAGVTFFYFDTYLRLSRQFPAIMALGLVASILGIPLWAALSARFERHRVWALALLASSALCAALALLTPGPAALPLCFVLFPLLFVALSSTVVAYAMSADIVDYGKLHTGEDHGGLYGALLTFLQKSVPGASTAAGVALAGVFGFDATRAVQADSAVLGLKLSFAILPACGLLMAAAIIWNYPLGRARVAEIQAALAARAAGAPR